MLTLFTDTDTDFTPRVAAEYGFKLISMPYSIDGETFFPYQGYDEFDFHAFYDRLRGGVLPTTSALGEDAYLRCFEPEFAAGNDILYIHFSAAMTMTFQSMDKALAILKEKYPERKFYGIDTKGITIVSYLITRELGDRLKAGMSAEEAVAWAAKEVDNFSQYFFADDLKFFRRSGRVGGLAATMGGLIGLRPVIHMSQAGKMESLGTVKGRVQVMERLVKYVEDYGDEIKAHRFIIGHTDAPELARQLAGMLQERFGTDLEIEFVCTNPTAGSHCGPNGVGIAFHSKGRLQ
ncbi:MAG: DegV family protein [Bacteroidales bacterium]|nr:DegV family protein [Bacteroidales bacterium]